MSVPQTGENKGGDGRLLALLVACLGEMPVARDALALLERAARDAPGVPGPWAALLGDPRRLEGALAEAEEGGCIRAGPEALAPAPDLAVRLRARGEETEGAGPARAGRGPAGAEVEEPARGAALSASRLLESALPRDPEDPDAEAAFDLLGPHALPAAEAARSAGVPADAALLAVARVAAHRAFRGDTAPAADLLASALDLTERAELADRFLAAVLADQLASALQDLGREAEAREAAGRAEREARAHAGPDDRRRAALLANVGTLYKRQGDFLTAEVHFRRALDELEDAGPEIAPLRGPTCLNLCDVLRAQGKPRAALGFARRAVQEAETALGPMHQGTADALESLALTLAEVGESEEARPIWARVAALYERHLGEGHPLAVAARRRLDG